MEVSMDNNRFVPTGCCAATKKPIGIQFVYDGTKYVAQGSFIAGPAPTSGTGVAETASGHFYTSPTFRCKRCGANYLYQCASCGKFICCDGAAHSDIRCPECDARISVEQSPQSRIIMRSGIFGPGADVVLAIDTSGSMDDYNRIEQVKRAAIDDFVSVLRGKCRIALVTFASSVNVVLPLCEDFDLIVNKIRSLSADGGTTSPFRCVREDADLQSFRQSTSSRYLVVFTDGAWAGDNSGHINSARELRNAGINIIAIGCAGACESFLSAIASENSAISVSDATIHGGFAAAADAIRGQG